MTADVAVPDRIKRRTRMQGMWGRLGGLDDAGRHLMSSSSVVIRGGGQVHH